MESRKKLIERVQGRASKLKKRSKSLNRHQFKRETAFTSVSAKKLKSCYAEGKYL